MLERDGESTLLRVPAVRDRPVEAAQLVASDLEKRPAVRDILVDIGIDKIAVRHFGIPPTQVTESFDFADINTRGRDFLGSYSVLT